MQNTAQEYVASPLSLQEQTLWKGIKWRIKLDIQVICQVEIKKLVGDWSNLGRKVALSHAVFFKSMF